MVDLFEFKRTIDCGTTERGREVEVVPLVAKQRSVREKEWLEDLRTFEIGKEDGKRIIDRLGHTLLNEHEKLFDSYWCHTFGSSSILLQLMGKDMSVRSSQSPPGRLKWRVHRNDGQTLTVEYSSSSIYILNMCESRQYLFISLSSF